MVKLLRSCFFLFWFGEKRGSIFHDGHRKERGGGCDTGRGNNERYKKNIRALRTFNFLSPFFLIYFPQPSGGSNIG